KSFETPKETLLNFMPISGRVHGTTMSLQTKHIYEFGPFRLDSAEHLLLRDGEAVALTPKAFDLLLALVEGHRHLLEKEELLKKVWPDTFVEEANLASNISQLRKALGDGENGQRYIETAPKRGYRFVAIVKDATYERAVPLSTIIPNQRVPTIEGEQSTNADELIPAHREAKAAESAARVKRYQSSAFITLSIVILLGASVTYFVLRAAHQPKVVGYTPITNTGTPKALPPEINGTVIPLVAGNAQLYFIEWVASHSRLVQVSSGGGETVAIPTAFPYPLSVLDLSPSRREMLVSSRVPSELEWQFWLL